tara:strand:- start:484 stop:1608 length:1125 start_codon:yes stop_codon:yes gene_type:complete
MKRNIKFQEPFKSNKIKKYVNEALNSNYYSSGYFENKVRELLKAKFGFKNTFITHSATGALEMAALLTKKKRNKKVFLPSYTFSSTANAFIRTGYDIEFLDINEKDLMINFEESTKKAKNNILVPVHYAGHSANMEGYKTYKKNGLLIEDAAQGLGTTWGNKQVGLFGHLAAVSFHHTKNIQGGFAGLLAVNDSKYLERARFIYERGTDRAKVISGLKNKYEWVEIGSSFQVPDILSAIILAQLEEYEVIIKKREKVHNFYSSYFLNQSLNSFLSVPEYSNKSSTNFHAFIIKFNNNSLAKKFIEYNKNQGVNCYIGYVPLHNSKKGKELKLDSKLEYTEKLSQKIVRLPIHTNISNEDIVYIKKTFDKFFKLN